jgi:general stress protein YciG
MTSKVPRGTAVALDGLAWLFRGVCGDNESDGRRNNVAKEDRGFASMDRAKQREIASKGGKAAHQKGTAHEWTSEEARDAGRKGGIASHRRRREALNQPNSGSVAVTETAPAGDLGEMRNRESVERSSSFEREDRTSDFGGNDRGESER